MPHNYGLISETDAKNLEKTIDLIIQECNDEVINVCEVGIYAGTSGKAIKQYIESKGRKCFLTGIDNNKDGEPLIHAPYYDRLIKGNSTDKYYLIEDDSQHLCFVDGNHSYIGVIGDFFAYKDKTKYLAFHDTGIHIKSMVGFQGGDESNPDNYISVSKALDAIGLFKKWGGGDIYNGTWFSYQGSFDFKLVFDQADVLNEMGGITVFKK